MAAKRVLIVLGKLKRGGAETLVMNIYRTIDRSVVQFDFIVHTPDRYDYDDEIESLGGKIYRFPQYNVLNHFEYKRCWNRFFAEHPEYRIIHAHMTGSASVFLPIAKKYGLVTIAHSHIALSQKGIRQKVIDLYRLPLKIRRTICLPVQTMPVYGCSGRKQQSAATTISSETVSIRINLLSLLISAIKSGRNSDLTENLL